MINAKFKIGGDQIRLLRNALECIEKKARDKNNPAISYIARQALDGITPTALRESEKDVFGWVIERDTSQGCAPEYYTGRSHPAVEWSDAGDHASAIRYATKEDAERIRGYLTPFNNKHRVCEHGWIAKIEDGSANG